MDKSHYCQEVVERAFDFLAKRNGLSKHVFVVLPVSLLSLFLKELAILHNDSKGDTLIPPFSTLLERFEAHYPFTPECVFSVQWVKKSGDYVPNLGTYYADNPKQEPAYPAVNMEEKAAIESMYTVLLSGDLTNLPTLELSELEKLEERSLEDERYDLAATIRDIRKQKTS